MKKFTMAIIVLIWSITVLGQTPGYSVGETVRPEDNLEWTTSSGFTTNIFEQTAQGKAVMLFFGQTW